MGPCNPGEAVPSASVQPAVDSRHVRKFQQLEHQWMIAAKRTIKPMDCCIETL